MSAFVLVVFVLFCLIAQAAIAPRIGIGEIAPDFVVLVVMMIALYRGAIVGALVGFVVGLVQDLGNPELLGLNALIKTLLGFAVGRVGSKLVPENALFLFGLVAAAAFCHDVMYLTVFMWPQVGSAFATIFVVALPSAVYTAVFAVVLDAVATRLGAKAVAIGKKRY